MHCGKPQWPDTTFCGLEYWNEEKDKERERLKEELREPNEGGEMREKMGRSRQ